MDKEMVQKQVGNALVIVSAKGNKIVFHHTDKEIYKELGVQTYTLKRGETMEEAGLHLAMFEVPWD